MKYTGIIRRVDDLGRIVIPKEIRQKLHIREGDPMEIHIEPDIGGIVFVKYQPNQTVRDAVGYLRTVVNDEKELAKHLSDKLLGMLSEMDELLKEETK